MDRKTAKLQALVWLYRQTGDDEVIDKIVDLTQEPAGYLELTDRHAAVYLHGGMQWIQLDN